jgi:hypothetical protein
MNPKRGELRKRDLVEGYIRSLLAIKEVHSLHSSFAPVTCFSIRRVVLGRYDDEGDMELTTVPGNCPHLQQPQNVPWLLVEYVSHELVGVLAGYTPPRNSNAVFMASG